MFPSALPTPTQIAQLPEWLQALLDPKKRSTLENSARAAAAKVTQLLIKSGGHPRRVENLLETAARITQGKRSATAQLKALENEYDRLHEAMTTLVNFETDRLSWQSFPTQTNTPRCWGSASLFGHLK